MIAHHIKSFLRSIRKNRFFYSINLIGFTTGFLIITVIISYITQELGFDRFNRDASNIYRLHPLEYGVTPQCFYEKLKNQIPEITDIVRFSSTDLIITTGEKEINIGKVYYTDTDVFKVFTFNLLSGDINTVLNSPFSIVVDVTTAQRIFGNSTPIGEIIKAKDGTIYTVTGIMDDIPFNSHIRGTAFISFESLRNKEDNGSFDCSTWSTLTYLSLSDNSESSIVEKKINTLLYDHLMSQENSKIPLVLEPLLKVYFDAENNKYDGCRHGSKQTIALYIAISMLILINVIINYINLSTAISGNRVKEIAVRKINGAGQIQIIKQIIAEAIGTALISYLISALLVFVLLPQISNLLNIPVENSASFLKIFLYGFAGVAATGLLAGLSPGLYIARIRETNALKDDIIFKTRGIQRQIMLVSQLFIAAVLLNSTLLINRQINYVLKKDLGFSYENIVYFTLNKDLIEREVTLKNTLLENPDIIDVTFSTGLIMGEEFGKSPVKINEIEKLCYFVHVDPGYLKVYNIKLKYGRNFSNEIKTDKTGSCIVNEEACRAFGIENPVGKTANKRIIIGVVNNFNFTSLHSRIEPLMIYCSEGQIGQIKISGNNKSSTLDYIKRICDEMSPDPERNYSFLDNRLKQIYKSDLDLKASFTIYSIIALIIALLGLFALTLFKMKKRTKEISIRKLFGAELIDIFKIIIPEQIVIAIISSLIALPVSLIVIKNWLDNFAYKAYLSPVVFLITFIVIAAILVLAPLFLVIRTFKNNLTATLKEQ